MRIILTLILFFLVGCTSKEQLAQLDQNQCPKVIVKYYNSATQSCVDKGCTICWDWTADDPEDFIFYQFGTDY